MAQNDVLGSTVLAAGDSQNRYINDEYFMRNLKRLKELRDFLIQEAIHVNTSDSSGMAFHGLNLLRHSPSGRDPTLEEWTDVERHTETLFAALTEPLRRRFVLGTLPMWVSILPILLAVIALFALIGAIMSQSLKWSETSIIAADLSLYLVWLMSLGAIGAVAFIGMNALSVQQDVTFDLTNRRLMIMRIALGALFGLVLTLPFGFQSFMEFIRNAGVSKPPASSGTPGLTTQATLLLLPFVLGFSTSLVIMILNRLVDAVQAFFGKSGTAAQGSATQGTVASSSRSLGTRQASTDT